MPRVTVVIPSYNHADYLSECLDSIRVQTFTDWEIILIDDGSTDGSVERARAYAEAEPRLKVLTNEVNLGTYGTEQRGVELAQGEFVAIMNSDDRWAPEKLAKQVERLDRHPECQACYVLGWAFGDVDQKLGEDVHADWPTDSVQEALPFLLYENRILASGVMFRREGLRFETTCRYSGDWVALLRAAAAGPLACVPERLTFWRQHETNSYRFSVKQIAEEIRVREAIRAQRTNWRSGRWPIDRIEHGIYRNLLNLFVLYVYIGRKDLARGAISEALSCPVDRKSALKRAIASYLPSSYLRKYFWPNYEQEMANVDPATVRTLVEQNSPLDLLK